MSEYSFSEGEIRAFRWAVMVATDALTLQREAGTMPQDDATRMIEIMLALETKINEYLGSYND